MLYEIFRSNLTLPEKVIELTLLIMVLAFTFSIHEFMHAWIAERMGDDTPRRQGRITMNPMAHIDPFGAIMMLLAGFGWAKPVQYNPNNLHKYSRRNCERLISLAGVTANLIVAYVASLLFVVVTVIFLKNPADSDKGAMAQSLVLTFVYYLREFNFMFLAFNLLPIPPLDGYRFISTFIPYNKRKLFDSYSQYSYYIFLGLLLFGRFGSIDLLGKIVEIVEWPFRKPMNLLMEPLLRFLLKVF